MLTDRKRWIPKVDLLILDLYLIIKPQILIFQT